MPYGPSLAVAVVPTAMLSLSLGHFSSKTDFITYKDMTASWLIIVTWPSPGLPQSTERAGRKPITGPLGFPPLEGANGN